MKAKFYPLLVECIELGVRLGVSRAHKHTENPSPETISENVTREIMNELNEWFDFE